MARCLEYDWCNEQDSIVIKSVRSSEEFKPHLPDKVTDSDSDDIDFGAMFVPRCGGPGVSKAEASVDDDLFLVENEDDEAVSYVEALSDALGLEIPKDIAELLGGVEHPMDEGAAVGTVDILEWVACILIGTQILANIILELC